MDAVLLAIVSAVLFGGMTVALRLALTRCPDAELGSLLTVLPALGVAVAAAVIRFDWDVAGLWPFALAGLLGPGISQVLFTLSVRDAGPARASVAVGTAPLVSVAIALVILGEPVVAGVLAGAVLIVGGGVLLVGERERPTHVKRIGLAYAFAATIVFASRDNLVRWLSIDTDVNPELAAAATLGSGTVAIAVWLVIARQLRGARPKSTRADYGRAKIPEGGRFASAAPFFRIRSPVASFGPLGLFVPAGILFGVSYVFLFEAYFRGRVTVVSPLVATESLWGVLFSAVFLRRREVVGPRLALGAVLIVAGGILIGVFR